MMKSSIGYLRRAKAAYANMSESERKRTRSSVTETYNRLVKQEERQARELAKHRAKARQNANTSQGGLSLFSSSTSRKNKPWWSV